jgi:hypothetical protein
MPSWRFSAGLPCVLLLLAPFFLSLSALGQGAFLSYNFDSGNLGDFFNPTGLQAVLFCDTGPIPSGEAVLDGGEVLLTNDSALGIDILTLLPSVVQSKFPASSRNYRLRVKIKLETVSELLVYVRARIKTDEAASQVNSEFERGYAFAIFPENIDQELTDGVLALAEFTACHDLVPHNEWPGGATAGFARVSSVTPIVPGDWYWLEAASQGNDDGGPVLLTGKIWADGDDAPDAAQIAVFDPDGLPHTPETLDPANDVEVVIGCSFDATQQPGATARIDDLSLTELKGCAVTPFTATRTLWSPKVLAEGKLVAAYAEGNTYDVSIALAGFRQAGICPAAGTVKIVEAVPLGWSVGNISSGGVPNGNTITWNLEVPPGGGLGPLTYKVSPVGGGLVSFSGEVGEPDSDFSFLVGGESLATSQEILPPVSDFGSIQHWLILGPYTRGVGGPNPGDDEIVKDYLTDGAVGEAEILPKAGETIQTDYNGAAASTGLAPNLLGRNPGDVPTWIEWRDYDDADDRIDFESVYGALNDVMCYGLTYLNVASDTVVSFGVSSDDSIHVLLDGDELLKHNVPRGALGRAYQDTPATFPQLGNVELKKGQHVLLVKVFEGGGEHNFRVGFVDENGLEIAGGPPEIQISLVPETGPPKARFHRGDSDNNGQLQLTDAVRILGFLFLGAVAPTCLDAADADGNNDLQLTDAVRILGFLFLGGAAPATPGPPPAACGPDNDEKSLGCAVYDKC